MFFINFFRIFFVSPINFRLPVTTEILKISVEKTLAGAAAAAAAAARGPERGWPSGPLTVAELRASIPLRFGLICSYNFNLKGHGPQRRME